MSFGQDGNMYMPVAPMGNGYGGDMLGGGIWWFLIIFVIAMMNGGWGNMWGGNGSGGVVNTVNNDVQRGFDQQATMSAIGDVNAAIVALSQAQCQGFSTVNANIASAAAAAESSANARQMANMQQMFGLSTQMSGLGADLAREACADRQAVSEAMMAVSNKIDALGNQITMQNYQNQIAQKDDIIAQLRSENLYARGQASQVAQNADIINGVYNRLNECPVGTVPVFGEQPIFTCNGNCQNRFGYNMR